MIPKTYKGLAKLLLEIAHNGMDYKLHSEMNERDELEFGEVIADIQNWLGENDILLKKLKLKYNG